MIFLCFIQNLTIAGSKEDFKSFFPTWLELSINYFEDFWVRWKKGVSYFFRGLNMNS
jgi:hypothetical protein